MPNTSEYTFNVEKKDTFIIVGGTPSVPSNPTLELHIILDDIYGTQSELSDEYKW